MGKILVEARTTTSRSGPESDVEQTFGPVCLVLALALFYGFVKTGNLWLLGGSLVSGVVSYAFFRIWWSIHKHPEQWRSVV